MVKKKPTKNQSNLKILKTIATTERATRYSCRSHVERLLVTLIMIKKCTINVLIFHNCHEVWY